MPPTFDTPVIPITFPRQQWWDSEWWNRDTKIGRVNYAAEKASGSWHTVLARREADSAFITPWTVKLAVFDRVLEINHELRRMRPYTGLHDTMESWLKETDGLIKMAFDEAVFAFPPKSPIECPPFEEVHDFVRVVINHHYVQGKDAEPAFTATGDWDEDEYVDEFCAWKREPRDVSLFRLVWPFDPEAAEQQEKEACKGYYQNAEWLHPRRSVAPEEWRPWKYKIENCLSHPGPTWDKNQRSGHSDDSNY